MKKFFHEGCFYCGSDEHRRHECPKMTAALKARGLRRVGGQWVPDPAVFDQDNEDWYLSTLGDDGEGGEMRVVAAPPPPAAGPGNRRPARPARLNLAASYGDACDGQCEGRCSPSRFAHATAWDLLADSCADEDIGGEFPELVREREPEGASAPPRGQLSRAPRRTPQAERKTAIRNGRATQSQQQRPAVQACFKSTPALQVVDKAAGPQLVRAVVDSGANESVTPPGLFPEPIVPSAMSRAGLSYTSANGGEIPNIGCTTVKFATPAGQRMGIQFQVGEGLTQPLISVAGLVDAGNVVTFDKAGGWIRSLRTGKRIRLPRDGNTFYLDMKVPGSPEEEGRGGADSPAAFRRPE